MTIKFVFSVNFPALTVFAYFDQCYHFFLKVFSVFGETIRSARHWIASLQETYSTAEDEWILENKIDRQLVIIVCHEWSFEPKPSGVTADLD